LKRELVVLNSSFSKRSLALLLVLLFGFALALPLRGYTQDSPQSQVSKPSPTVESSDSKGVDDASFERRDQDPDDDSAVTVASEAQPHEATAKLANRFDPAETFFSGTAPRTLEELRELERKFAEIAELVQPATVNIQMGGSQGSGIVVTRDGYVLTAAHVIGEPFRKATVTFPDGRKFTATSLGNSTGVDSGILKIEEGQADEFPYVDMGISSELKPGQWVLAIGHPGGIDEKRGLVVRAGRVLSSSERVIQTDCTLVGGDSGGPLVDLNGEVVGIHSRIGMNLWDNLHVPVDVYSENWDRLIEGVILTGTPGLGFTIEGETTKIESISKNGPAEKAGMQVGDVIKKVGNRTTETLDDLKAATRELLPNMKIKILVQRGEEEIILDVVVGRKGR
jgi:serine protease Do